MNARRKFTFQGGNLSKLLTIPVYLLGLLASLFVPRRREQWALGSGMGFGEGSKALAEALRIEGTARVMWIAGTPDEQVEAERAGLPAVQRASFRGFWHTLRSETLVVTHGFGDVNRFAVFGANVVNLWHGPPLKKLHLDSPVTTKVNGPNWVRNLLQRMYRQGAKRVTLFVTGSPLAAQRLRTAFGVQPGRVQAFGDARLDVLRQQLLHHEQAIRAREQFIYAAGIPSQHAERPIVLYAPTWRDGEADPAAPDPQQADEIRTWAQTHRVHLVIRSHPLGAGDYKSALSDWVHELSADTLAELSTVLSQVDVLITDYSSAAVDFSLTSKPIVWFAPDLQHYAATRGLYEPYEVTTENHWHTSWQATLARVTQMLDSTTPERQAAVFRTRRLAARFHVGGAAPVAASVLAMIRRELGYDEPGEESVFFESFYGRIATCNPYAIDREIAARHPDLRRVWSVDSEDVTVPEGAEALLVGGEAWDRARKQSKLLIVNDWLRYDFRPRRGQRVLQTWHGTPLKQLALGRPSVSLRTRLAIRRESARWHLLLSQNSHCTAALTQSYDYRGEVLQTGYPRNDRLARGVADGSRIGVVRASARARLGIDQEVRVLLYAPTWRDMAAANFDLLGLDELSRLLGQEWVILHRGHSRVSKFHAVNETQGRIIDVTRVPEINDLLLAADVLITDYSSLMFDASVAHLPMGFFVPDMDHYEQVERGFTLPFRDTAPGPLMHTREAVAVYARQVASEGGELEAHALACNEWRERFNALDDGGAAARVVDELERRALLGARAIDHTR